MAATFLLGRNAKAYFNENAALIGEIGAGPDLNTYVQEWLDDSNTRIADNMVDVGLNIGSEFADGTTRATAAQGFASQIPVLRNGEVTFEARWLPEDPTVTPPPFSFTRLLLNAWQNDSRIAVVFLDQSRANPGPGQSVAPQGLAANWSVSLEKSENLRDVQRLSVSLTIADSGLWYSETIQGT